MKLGGQVAIVTGASRGLGAAIARALAHEGAQVALVGRRQKPLRALARQIGALALPADVSKFEECRRVVETTADELGAVDVLVNNAGVGIVGQVEDASVGDWELMWDVNFKGTAFCSKAVLPRMLERGRGDIVNIASAGGTRGIPNWSGYCASKFAVVGFAQALAQEVVGRGVRVQTLCPGGIDTPFWDDLNEDIYPAGSAGRREIMSPESVAEIVVSVLAQPRNVLMRQALFFPVNEWH